MIHFIVSRTINCTRATIYSCEVPRIAFQTCISYSFYTYKVFEAPSAVVDGHMDWKGIWWMHTHADTTTHITQNCLVFAEVLCISSVSAQRIPVTTWYGWRCISTISNCISHPCHTYVFEHLLLLWMGIWMQTHSITTTNITPVSLG